MKTIYILTFKILFLYISITLPTYAQKQNNIKPIPTNISLNSNQKLLNELSLPLSEKIIYSKGVSLKRNAVIQNIDISRDGSIYYVQIAGTNKHQLHVLHGNPNEDAPSKYMTFEYFGHGTNMAIEETTDGTYVWLGSHGNKGNDGAYGGSQTICRVKFIPGTSVQHAAGDIFYLEGIRNIHPAINSNKDLLGIEYSQNHNGEINRIFVIYRLSEALQIMPTTITLQTRKYGGETKEQSEKKEIFTIQAKDLSKIQPVYQFKIVDGRRGFVGEYAFQGFDIDEQHVYYYEGMGYNSTISSKAYVSILNKKGELVNRKEVIAITDAEKLKKLHIADRGYMEAEGIKVKNNTLYLGFASRLMKDNKDKRLANIFIYRIQ